MTEKRAWLPQYPKVVWVVAFVLFGGSFLYRFLEVAFHNDHFEYLALATEILNGAVPGIDFFDPTRPLQYYASAAGLWFGHQLLAEALLCVTLLSAGAALVFFLGLEISGAVSLGAMASFFVVAILPRLYSYPKIIVPALALLFLWRYVDRPAPSRLAAVALATAVSFYSRFDYGMWVAFAVGASLLARHWRAWRPLATAAMQYACVVVLLCGPYVVMQVAMGGGLTSGPGSGRLRHLLQGEDVVSLGLPGIPSERPLLWFRPAGPLATVRWVPNITAENRLMLERQYSLRMVRVVDEHARQYVLVDRSPATLARLIVDPSVEATTNIDDRGGILREPPWSVLRRWLHVPVVESPLLNQNDAMIWLYDALFLTPVLAAAVLAVRAARRRAAEGETPKVLAVIVLSVLFNIFLIRGNLDSHLPDVIVPAALLWAWMMRGAYQQLKAGAPARFGVATVALVLLWLTVDVYAGSVNQLTASDLFSTPRQAARRLYGTIRDLRRDPLEQFAPPGATGLRALTRYVHRCTRETDRLLVLGYQPEMFFYANRRIGGGNVVYQANLGAAPRQQATIVARLQRESVPIVILPANRVAELEQVYPIVKDYVYERYELARESGFGEDRLFRVLVDRRASFSTVDPELGLPCFTGSAVAANATP